MLSVTQDQQPHFYVSGASAAEHKASWLDGISPVALVFSSLLHLSIVLFMIVGIPFMPKPPLVEIEQIVAVDFVEIAEKTESDREASKAKNKNDRTRADQKKPDIKPLVEDKKTKPKPRSAPTVNAKQQPLTVSQDKDNSVPPPPSETVPMPEEAKPEKPNLAPKKPSKTPNKRPKKPKKQPVKPKQQEQSFDSVLKNLQISENSSAAEEEGKRAQSAAPKVPTLGQRITISELDALRAQLAQCWNVLAGANFDKALVVDIKLFMNPDRTVRKAQVVDKIRYSTDSFFRAAADSAMRAVNNPSCSPLNLPAGKYDQWKEINVRFDPREML